MRTKFIISMVFILSISFISFAAETAGIISDYNGTIKISRGTETINADIGTELFEGDKVKPGAESSVDILMANGDFINIEAGEEKTIILVVDITRAKKRYADKTEDFFSSDNRKTVLADAVSLREGDEIATISPRSSTINKRPGFYWTVDSDSVKEKSFTIILMDSNGKEIFKQVIKNKFEFDYPDDAPELIPGKIYTWVIITESENYASEETYFKIMPKDKLDLHSNVYREFRKKYITSKNTLNISYGNYLIKQKLYSDAFVYFNELNKKTPKSVYIHQMLAITHLRQKLLLPYNKEINLIKKLK
ncbi:hypothetical protein KAU33_01960 [Candidatus Dependentiae bacterium]|nr:hypothetical protein [Candidatus Dependentiae bacterium]